MSDERMAYIGRRECGNCVAAAVDDPGHKKDTADFVRDMIKEGLAVERVTVTEGRDALCGKCDCPECVNTP
jgi:hypothetical protein